MYNDINYSQPEFYRFSEDSVYLAKLAAEIILIKFTQFNQLSGLDLCAGCGVVGIETLMQLPAKDIAMDFMESQKEYQGHFAQNIEQFKKLDSFNRDFNFFSTEINDCLNLSNYYQKYDFIIANPPYFLIGEGLRPRDMRRDKCRFWNEQDRINFLKFIDWSLKQKGMALIALNPIWRPRAFFEAQMTRLNQSEIINKWGFNFWFMQFA